MPPAKRSRDAHVVLESVPIFDAQSMSSEAALKYYWKHQFLHIRTGHAESLAPLQGLFMAFEKNPEAIERHWTIENAGRGGRRLLTAPAFFNCKVRFGGQFYVSTILQGTDGIAEDFLRLCPTQELPFVQDWGTFEHSLPVWVFVGCNTMKEAMQGRPEHTDDVQHSGTWHYQMAGTKTWFIRPLSEHRDWLGKAPVLRGCTSLEVTCQAGDIFIINTRLWWHRTSISSTSSSPSKCVLVPSSAVMVCVDCLH
jgi:hypothetical protein